MSDSVNAENLRRLSAEFQKDFDRQEAIVLSYLHLHPEKARSFQKNGSTYYLTRIGDDGNPVYITTRSENSVKHQPSDRPINLGPTNGGGPR